LPTINMYAVYILKSKSDGSSYVGSTSKDCLQRVLEHHKGSNRSTKWKGPYDLIHYEEYGEKSVALARERFFKTGNGRKVLKNILGKKG